MVQQVTFFFDWQNIYMRAREAYLDGGSRANEGQVDPVELAKRLLEKYRTGTGENAVIKEIRIYRGRPDGVKAPKAYAAFQRQLSQWKTNSKVTVVSSDLRYPRDWDIMTQRGSYPAREKGIDVALAVDLVHLASVHDFDHAIVMSADFDLVPAIKLVYAARGRDLRRPGVNVAAWKSPSSSDRPLRIQFDGGKPYCHWLNEDDYLTVVDATDYTLPRVAALQAAPVPGPFHPRI